MLRTCLLVIFALGVSLHTSHGCMCPQGHPQNLFCSDTAFVVKAQVRDVLYVDNPYMGKRYTINIIEVFKGQDIIGNRTEVYVYTNSDGWCGMRYYLDQRYAISGWLADDGKLKTSGCTFNKYWSEVTEVQIRGLTGVYAESCGCELVTNACQMDSSRLLHDNGHNRCIMQCSEYFAQGNQPDSPEECLKKHSWCSRRDDGNCQWHRTTEFLQCTGRDQ